MTGEPEGLTAVLLQLAGHTQKLAELDQRQAGDARQLGERTAALAAAVNDLTGTTTTHAKALAALAGLDSQVTALTAQITSPAGGGSQGEPDPAGYRPSPQPRFWKLDGQARDEAAGKLRAWVEQVYRPGYGHLSASLGDCWEQHPLCLYVLDWLSELWSVLYLAPARTPGTLAGQAEWHTRLLAAAAEHLSRETRGCAHGARSRPALPGERP